MTEDAAGHGQRDGRQPHVVVCEKPADDDASELSKLPTCSLEDALRQGISSVSGSQDRGKQPREVWSGVRGAHKLVERVQVPDRLQFPEERQGFRRGLSIFLLVDRAQ
jgi:hypothetical protein